jgi:hypothetical protein
MPQARGNLTTEQAKESCLIAYKDYLERGEEAIKDFLQSHDYEYIETWMRSNGQMFNSNKGVAKDKIAIQIGAWFSLWSKMPNKGLPK